MSRNDITNDEIKSKILSEQGRKNHDLIFAKRSFCDWCLIEGVEIKQPTTEEKISYFEFKQKINQFYGK